MTMDQLDEGLPMEVTYKLRNYEENIEIMKKVLQSFASSRLA